MNIALLIVWKNERPTVSYYNSQCDMRKALFNSTVKCYSVHVFTINGTKCIGLQSSISHAGSSLVGLVVRIPGFHGCGLGSVPGLGTEILEAAWCDQNKTKQNLLNLKNCCSL